MEIIKTQEEKVCFLKLNRPNVFNSFNKEMAFSLQKELDSCANNEAIRERFRPVLITTITTIVGLTRIIFEGSLQARLIQPLAITFIFGMLFVPYLVLVFVPALICFVNDMREGKYNLRLKLRLTQKTS